MKTWLKISLFFLLLTQIQYSQWVQVGPSGLTIYSLATSGSNVFAGTYLTGVYKSTDSGQTWSPTSLNSGSIHSLALIGSTVFAGSSDGLYQSTDNGQTWALSTLGNIVVNSIVVNGSDMFAGTGGGIYYSSDSGLFWVQTSLNNYEVYSIAISNTYIFAGTFSGVLRSSDYGQTWSQPSLYNIGVQSITTNGSNVIAGTWEEGLFYSSDNGETWSNTSALYHVPALLFNNPLVFAGSNGVYHSSNNGQNWTNVSQGLPGGYTVLALAVSEEYIYAGMVFGYSVWRRPLSDIVPVELTSFTASLANSEVLLSWTTATETNNMMFEIERRSDNSDFVLIGFVEGKGTTTEQQEYSYEDRDVTAGKYFYRLKQIDFDGKFEYSNEIEVDAAPVAFSLEQNYPNPFNPSTTIRYSIPTSEFVTLKVYDVLGNEVATLANEEKSAGSYEVELSASELSSGISARGGYASGIYFYKLQAGNFVETKKMLLLK